MRCPKIVSALSILVALAGCAGAPVEEYVPPQVTVKAPSSDVRAKLLGVVLGRGYSVTRESQSVLVVDKPSDNVVANALLGSRMRPVVNARVTFTFVETGGSTRVVGDLALVTNPGTGIEQLTPVRLPSEVKTIQGWLDQAAGR